MWKVIRYRRLQALVIASLAALITACAVFAPLYDRAMQQALVTLRMDQEPPATTGLRLTSRGTHPVSEAMDVARVEGLVPEDIRTHFLSPVPNTSVSATVEPVSDNHSPTGSLFWQQGMCKHLTFSSGGCPSGNLEVAVSAADATANGWRVGSTIKVGERVDTALDDVKGLVPHPRLQVVGVYGLRPGDHFFGRTLTGLSGLQDQDSSHLLFDHLLTSEDTFSVGTGKAWVDPVNEINLPADKANIGVDELTGLGPAVAEFLRSPYTSPPSAASMTTNEIAAAQPPVTIYSGLPDIAEEVADGRTQARVVVPLLMVQLGLLAVVVLWLVLGAATEQRRPEVAISRLRGRGVAGARRLLLRELGTIVLAGVPFGVVAGLGLCALARHAFLPGAAPFEVGRGFVVALAAACAMLLDRKSTV